MSEPSQGRRRRERPGRNGRAARNERLRAVLRRGDPDGDGRAPSTVERAALRRRIVDAAGAPSFPAWGRLPAIASALIVLAVLAGVSLYWFGAGDRLGPPQVAGREAAEEPAAGAIVADRSPAGDIAAGNRSPAGSGDRKASGTGGEAPPSIRNVQFVTSGGTRIVWVLNRNLDI